MAPKKCVVEWSSVLICCIIAAATVGCTVAHGAHYNGGDNFYTHVRKIRALEETSMFLTQSCSLSAARDCALAQTACLENVPHDQQQEGVCDCYQSLGKCLHTAHCFNGTYEDLHTQYCITGDSYCCSSHGEINGCGERLNFNTTALCACEDLYGGTYCNTTSATCSSDNTKCNVCSICCKDYSQDTCDSCVAYECDRNVCTDSDACTTCGACCKSYLTDQPADCNLCVEDEC